MKTQTTVKTTKAPKAKAAPKSKAKEQPTYSTAFPYAALLADCLVGLFGPAVAGYFATARNYHETMKTQFPRIASAGFELMPVEKCREYLASVGANPAARIRKDGTRLRMYDEMRVQQAASQDGFAKYAESLLTTPPAKS
jgi:hypothetical protein